VVLGSPAIEADVGRRAYSMLQYLPEMRQNIRELQNRICRHTSSVESNPDESDEPNSDI